MIIGEKDTSLPDFFEEDVASDLEEKDLTPEVAEFSNDEELSYGTGDGEREETEEERTLVDDWDDPDIVAQYLREATRHPILSGEKEIELFKMIDVGKVAEERLNQLTEDDQDRLMLERQVEEGKTARQFVIEHNLKLVISIAKHYRGSGLPFSDLIQEGNMGLMTAAKEFDWRYDNRFASYAFWWIKQAILKAIGSQVGIIRLPVGQEERLRKMGRIAEGCEKEQGGRPSDQEVAEILGLSPKQLEMTMAARATRAFFSLDEPIEEGRETEFGAFVSSADEDGALVVQNLLRGELIDVLNLMVREKKISEREGQIIKLRYGLEDSEGLTLETIGEILGISKQRVGKLEEKVLRRLRNPRYSRRLRPFVEELSVSR